MNSGFDIERQSGISMLAFRPWIDRGVIHGMTTKDIGFRNADFEVSATRLKRCLGLTGLVIPKQVHGNSVINLRTREAVDALFTTGGSILRTIESDAVIAPSWQQWPGHRIGIGVMAADCVPILIASEDVMIAIHAGWRGLANGVISTVITQALPSTAKPEAVIFATAGPDRYEVGPEVIEAIGDSAVFRKGEGDRILLDLTGTARRQLLSAHPAISVESANVCTISEPRLHSFRRDAEASGRGVSVIIPRG